MNKLIYWYCLPLILVFRFFENQFPERYGLVSMVFFLILASVTLVLPGGVGFGIAIYIILWNILFQANQNTNEYIQKFQERGE